MVRFMDQALCLTPRALQHSRSVGRAQVDGDAARCVNELGLLAREQDDLGKPPHRTGREAALECLEASP